MTIHLPWFLPLSLMVGAFGTKATRLLSREGKSWLDAGLMLILCWFPVFIWCIAQLLPETQR